MPEFRVALNIVKDNMLSDEVLARNLAAIARLERDAAIRSGAAEPNYETIVDGRKGANEDTVRVDGYIRYIFGDDLASAVRAAYIYLRGRSPRDSGAFRRAWVIVVDGEVWARPMEEIPGDKEVWITNPQPYARKIETGGMVTKVHPFLIEDAQKFVNKQFPRIMATRAFIRIRPGTIQLENENRYGKVPYILKGQAVRSGLTFDRRRKRFIQLEPPRKTNARDRRAGAEMTYPTLVLENRIK